jgi:transcriptional regulator with XRE-family HTH domain
MMSGGEVIREARLLAGLSQQELADRAGVPRPSIVRWERGTVEPGFDMVRRLLRSCGFDVSLVRYEPDEAVDDRLSERLTLTPQERLRLMLGDPGRSA